MTNNVKNTDVFPTSTFSTSSTTFVNVLNGAGGSPVAVTLTKSTGTNIFVRGGCSSIISNVFDTVTLGVNDGTTDYNIARAACPSAVYGMVHGEVMITGLSAGTYTFTLRLKSATPRTIDLRANLSHAFLTASEVTP